MIGLCKRDLSKLSKLAGLVQCKVVQIRFLKKKITLVEAFVSNKNITGFICFWEFIFYPQGMAGVYFPIIFSFTYLIPQMIKSTASECQAPWDPGLG